MAVGIAYVNAKIFINGAEVTAALHEFSAMYSAEMLDGSVFGVDTRIKKGGLKTGSMSGKGFVDTAVDLDDAVFAGLGGGATATFNPAYASGAIVEDTIMVVFPDGITEGGTTTGMGYAMKCVLEKMDIGGAVGVLTPLTFSAQSRGIEAA